jgi:hypothetical protein
LLACAAELFLLLVQWDARSIHTGPVLISLV